MSKREEIIKMKLAPLPNSGATIIVFNTIQQGMYQKFEQQLKKIERDLDQEGHEYNLNLYYAFGPFDNMIRFDYDDFCLVNRISAMAGISSQQIQCAYTLWRYSGRTRDESAFNGFRPFCSVTQLKLQNHLMLGHGPEIEAAVASLISGKLKEFFGNKPGSNQDLEVELMATLGWDEFFIFMQNFRGYSSMFNPILELIRPLTLYDLQEHSGIQFKLPPGKDLKKKHLFLTSYSTPAYDMRLNKIIEEYLEAQRKAPGSGEFINATILKPDKLFRQLIPSEFRNIFGVDDIRVSTRLSIKPGHLDEVKEITHKVLDDTEGWKGDTEPAIDELFSIGRYDVYPWLNARLKCKNFITHFGLLNYALAGNLPQGEKSYTILKYTQFYNSFTIISYVPKRKPKKKTEEDKTISAPPDAGASDEGGFIKQLKHLALSGLEELDTPSQGKSAAEKLPPLLDVFEKRDILKKFLPISIVYGLMRIFALFDSCIMDRFTCDSFLDMYPFMQRVREIFDTVEPDPKDKKKLIFHARINRKETHTIPIFLPESAEQRDPLTTVFLDAIERFYRGFVHRYMSSYPMMDKNEAGIDYSGRMHRMLSAITGMQNLLMEDLDCHNKKGFNVISTYPGIQINRGSFNVTESNVFYLFQVETFFVLFHEAIHTLVHTQEGKGKAFAMVIDNIVDCYPNQFTEKETDPWRFIVEEIVGDLMMIKNVFPGDIGIFSYWYWLMILKYKSRIDTQVLLRFLVIVYVLDGKSHDIFNEYSNAEGELNIKESRQLPELFGKLLRHTSCPTELIGKIVPRIEPFFEETSNIEEELFLLNVGFCFLKDSLSYGYCKLDHLMKKHCYPAPDKMGDFLNLEKGDECYRTPLIPMVEPTSGKRQIASITLLRSVLAFVHRNREQLSYEEDGIINFKPKFDSLRLDLFTYRTALINTLQWESLHWKKQQLNVNDIHFRVERILEPGSR